ncbi:hypothetical protein [Roseicella aquatilis]|uniref:Uncharacterized protein n=1 Tax=Roseicella aquatilis TaxID=2527868 RepID=A0A4R4D852_9PROT|nr:hypothetical protein [Roseicella aquatilis]TCZ56646.1 hypothetical protein EXY23_19855 [Roseicella aquatilis]
MTLVAVLLAEVLVRPGRTINLPSWIGGWVCAGRTPGALGGTEEAAACEAIAQRLARVLAAPAAGVAAKVTQQR